jgi:hypothetical protein
MRRACVMFWPITKIKPKTNNSPSEIEAAHEMDGVTLMAVPTELVPEVRALLARSKSG